MNVSDSPQSSTNDSDASDTAGSASDTSSGESRESAPPPPPNPERSSSTPGERVSAPVPSSAVKSARVARAEVGTDEQKKLEDIRKKLKDIFVTGEKAPPPKEETIKAGAEQTASSGLLDLRDLAKERRAKEQPEQRVDDDMLFLSGGLFDGPRTTEVSLAPPDLTARVTPPPPKPPPPARAAATASVEEVDVDLEPESKDRPKLAALAAAPSTAIISAPVAAPFGDEPLALAEPKKPLSTRALALIGVAFVGLLGVVFYVTMTTGTDDAPDTSGSARVGAEVTPTSTTAADTSANAATAIASATAEAPAVAVISPGDKGSPASASASAKAETAPSAKASAKPGGDKEPATGPATTAVKPEGPPASPQTTGAAPPPPPAETAKPAPPPPPPADEFDRSAASAALAAAASRAAACKADGPGSASVSVTFATSGRVTSARVEGGTFAGTPTGGCIATAFRGASVPPFGGSPVTVKKNVSIR